MKRAFILRPDLADSYVDFGLVLHEQRRFDAAETFYGRALVLKPDSVEAHNNLGNIQRERGRPNDALLLYKRALALKPDLTGALMNLGATLQDRGLLDGAISSLGWALALKPDFAEGHYNMALALQSQRKQGEARQSYGLAILCKPNYAEAHSNLGNLLGDMEEPDMAMVSYRRALACRRDLAEAHNSLGLALKGQGLLEAAARSFRCALIHRPDHAEALSNLGNALKEQGMLDEAVLSLRQALASRPSLARAHSNLLLCLSHRDGLSAKSLFAEHVRFGERFESPMQNHWPTHGNDRDPDRRLRVGFVSGDLRSHAVAHFVEPVLAQLAANDRLLLHAYANWPTEDDVTHRLRSVVARWTAIVDFSDDALANRIRADGIDILVDLSGHTAMGRLLTFAKKAAPLQVSWIGYPGTTGLRAMDYFLTDRFFLPPGQFDDQFTERLVYLPASAPFLPAEDAPPVNRLPALENGYMTFGSFNRLSKINPSIVAVWSQLLRALPEARLLLGAMPQDMSQDRLITLLAQERIGRERLHFAHRSGMADYLALHHGVDLCLDSFPYTGATTANHALWMGVPTLTLSGQTVPGRLSAAQISHVGLDDFIARDKDDFVEKGLFWASNLSQLAELRAGLRERCEQSPIRRPEIVADGLARAFRIMWQRWCEGLPPETFEVSRKQIQ